MPLSSSSGRQRALDYVYIGFFVVHLLASVLVDGQYFYPSSLVPTSLSEVKAGYLKGSNDPLLASLGFPESAWFTAAVILELAIQCPCFIYGSWALYKDRPSAYPLLIAYASLASSSTLFCLVQALCGPTSSTLTSAHRQAIWQAYGPFLLVPTIMLVDMLSRCHHLIQSLPVVDRKVKSK